MVVGSQRMGAIRIDGAQRQGVDPRGPRQPVVCADAGGGAEMLRPKRVDVLVGANTYWSVIG
jgi:hypothetical protein